MSIPCPEDLHDGGHAARWTSPSFLALAMYLETSLESLDRQIWGADGITRSSNHRVSSGYCNGMQWIRGNFVKLVLIGAFGISKSGYRVDLKNVKHIFWKCRGFYCFNQLQHLGPVKSPQLPGRFRSKLLPLQRRENRRCGSNGHDVE